MAGSRLCAVRLDCFFGGDRLVVLVLTGVCAFCMGSMLSVLLTVVGAGTGSLPGVTVVTGLIIGVNVVT